MLHFIASMTDEDRAIVQRATITVVPMLIFSHRDADVVSDYEYERGCDGKGLVAYQVKLDIDYSRTHSMDSYADCIAFYDPSVE